MAIKQQQPPSEFSNRGEDTARHDKGSSAQVKIILWKDFSWKQKHWFKKKKKIKGDCTNVNQNKVETGTSLCIFFSVKQAHFYFSPFAVGWLLTSFCIVQCPELLDPFEEDKKYTQKKNQHKCQSWLPKNIYVYTHSMWMVTPKQATYY